jgi:hypothetical protein
MKHKMLALVLALTVVSWAQTSAPNASADPQQNAAPEKAKAGCCDKMDSAGSKDAMICSRHGEHSKDAKASCCAGKKAKSCCAGKDGKSCMKDDKNAASCCKDCSKDKVASACCGKDCKEGCCSKKTEAATSCCKHASNG